MKILALDQAMQVSGVAIFDNDKLVYSDTFTIQASLPIEKRLGKFWEKLTELYHDYEFTTVIFEDIQMQHGNVETYKKLAYCQCAIMLWCYFNDIKYRIYAPSAWRAVLGKGWGKKREEQKEYAIQLVKEIYNKDVDSDTADAILIGIAYNKDVKESAF